MNANSRSSAAMLNSDTAYDQARQLDRANSRNVTASATSEEERRRVKHEAFLSDVPPKLRLTMSKAYEGVASPRQAIKAMCLECVQYQRAEITGCTVHRCPLWLYRPYRLKKVGEQWG